MTKVGGSGGKFNLVSDMKVGKGSSAAPRSKAIGPTKSRGNSKALGMGKAKSAGHKKI